MTTPHEQLLELEPLMRKLGWWPEDLIFGMDDGNGSGQPYVCIILKTSSGGTIITNTFALHIVTGIAETELCGRERREWRVHRSSLRISYIAPPSRGSSMLHSLADALRVEIERKEGAKKS
jgi:hypothetical protein